MAGTMSFSSIYGRGGESTQEARNVGGTAKVPTRGNFEVPVMSNAASYWGISLWVLLALGVMGWWLIEAYD